MEHRPPFHSLPMVMVYALGAVRDRVIYFLGKTNGVNPKRSVR